MFCRLGLADPMHMEGCADQHCQVIILHFVVQAWKMSRMMHCPLSSKISCDMMMRVWTRKMTSLMMTLEMDCKVQSLDELPAKAELLVCIIRQCRQGSCIKLCSCTDIAHFIPA